MSMKEDLVLYDRKGFVPSRDVRTVDEYLRESERKLRKLRDFEEDPHGFVAQNGCIEDDFQIVRPSDDYERRFYERFQTDPLPGIYANPDVYKRIVLSQHPIGKILGYLAGRMGGGTILRFGNQPNLYIPIVCKDKSIDNEGEVSKFLCHETVHCIRQQRRGDGFINHLLDAARYGPTEEFIAGYHPFYHPFSKELRPFVYPLIKHPSLQTAIIAPFLIYPIIVDPMGLGGVEYALILGSWLVHGSQTYSFFKRCEKEGLNPDYLFLRSNPSEYSRKESIRDQLYRGKNLGFDIMAHRLDLSPKL